MDPELTQAFDAALKDDPTGALDVVDALVARLPLDAVLGVVERRLLQAHRRAGGITRFTQRDVCEQFIESLRTRFP